MARYKVAHDLHPRTWIGLDSEGKWAWLPYEQAYKFQNYFKAKEALDSLPVERRMYGFPYKPHFMKVEYTEAEKNLPGNEWMRN